MSLVAVPLLLQDLPVGVLVGVARQRRSSCAEEVAPTQALATSVAVAIRNARLHEETQLRLRHTETLVSVSQAIGSTLDLTESCGGPRARWCARWAPISAPRGCARKPKIGSCRWSAITSPRRSWPPRPAAWSAMDDPFFTQSKQRPGGPLCSEDSQNDPRFATPLGRLIPHRSMLVQPIYWQEELIGGCTVVWSAAPAPLHAG